MRISLSELRYLISELILEGRFDDALKEFPDLKFAIDAKLKPNVIDWLLRQLRKGLTEPVVDVVPTLEEFTSQAKQNLLKARGKKTDVNGYTSVDEIRDALEEIGESRDAAKKNINMDDVTSLGRFGTYDVFMPHTREASVNLGQGTKWCTSTTSAGNMFYYYTAGLKIFLFYLIDRSKDRSDKTRKLSVGVQDGQAILPCDYGGASVNAAQDGLSIGELQDLLGEHEAVDLVRMLEYTAKKFDKHPAEVKFSQIVNDPKLLKRELDRVRDDKITLKVTVLTILKFGVGNESLHVLANDSSVETRAVVAGDEKTPDDVLKKLARDTEWEVKSAVAQNYNASSETLDLMRGDADSDIRYSVVTHPNVTASTLDFVARRELSGGSENTQTDVLQRIADSEMTPVSTLRAIAAECDDADVLHLLASNDNLTADMLDLLAKKADRNDWRAVLNKVAEHANSSPALLRWCASHEITAVKRRAALNKNTPDDALKMLSTDINLPTRINLINNPSVSQEILDSMVDDPRGEVRFALASKSSSPATLRKIASSPQNSNVVKKAIASNPHTPDDVLENLARDDDWSVRMRIAKNKNMSAAILDMLAYDEYADIRVTVVENPSTAHETLIRLSSDQSRAVSATARERLAQIDNM
jgi:hypothetical protein